MAEELTVHAEPAEAEPNEAHLLRQRIANVEATVMTACRRGRFLIAAFSVEGGQLYKEWHTHDFPSDDLLPSCDMLRTDLKAEAHATSEPKVLPEAEIPRPKPMDMMFGKVLEKATDSE